MKVTVIGAMLGNGISSKSGAPKPYSIESIDYLVPAQDFIQGDHNIQKCGGEVKSIKIEHSLTLYMKIKNLLANNLTAQAELVLSPDPTNPSRNIVTDIKAA